MSDEQKQASVLSQDDAGPRDFPEAQQAPPPPKPPGPLRRFWRRNGFGILLALTIMTTLLIGFESVVQQFAFENNISYAQLGNYYDRFFDPIFFFPTLVYAVCLLGFLTAHEMGHYLMCRRYGIDASLPYYLPNPLIFGTFGAVIRIREPIRDKQALFDIAIAGPLAGFVVAVPVLFFGLMQSVIVPVGELASSSGDSSFWILGEPLLQKLIDAVLYPNTGDVSLVMSPLAMVGWFACLVTSINLLPVSQLDGGHIFYAVFGKRHFIVSVIVLITMIALAVVFQYYGWLVWGLLVALLGLRHPPLMDEARPLGKGRLMLAAVALIVFVLCFIPVPIELP